MTADADLSMADLTPILFGAAAFQYLNAGCRLGLFELLHQQGDLTDKEIREGLDLAERAADILLLGTTSLRLTRKVDGRYRNADVISAMWRDGTWQTFADIVAFEAEIVYDGQADLVASLRENTNVGLRRIRGTGRDLYHRFAENPEMERVFYQYMASWSKLGNSLLVRQVDFSDVTRLLDVGGGDGVNAVALAEAYPQLQVQILEIPASAPIARREIARRGLSERVTVHECDIHHDAFPAGADCVLFAHQLVIWRPEENVALLRRGYDALRPGGRVVVFNSFSNDEGDGPLMAALDSGYFAAIPAEGGMIYRWEQHESWLRDAGFSDVRRVPFQEWTPHGALIATKPAL